MVSQSKSLGIAVDMYFLLLWCVGDSPTTRAGARQLIRALAKLLVLELAQDVRMVPTGFVPTDHFSRLGCLIIDHVYLNILENTSWIQDRPFDLIKGLWSVVLSMICRCSKLHCCE